MEKIYEHYKRSAGQIKPIKKCSSKQAAKNRTIAKIKESLPSICFICGKEGDDAAHLLPKSIYPEYYTLPANIVILCREHHNLYDNNIEFRKKQMDILARIMSFDEKAAIKYFQL